MLRPSPVLNPYSARGAWYTVALRRGLRTPAPQCSSCRPVLSVLCSAGLACSLRGWRALCCKAAGCRSRCLSGVRACSHGRGPRCVSCMAGAGYADMLLAVADAWDYTSRLVGRARAYCWSAGLFVSLVLLVPFMAQ